MMWRWCLISNCIKAHVIRVSIRAISEREQHRLCLFHPSAAEGKHKTLLSHSHTVLSIIRQLLPAAKLRLSKWENNFYTFVVVRHIVIYCLLFSRAQLQYILRVKQPKCARFQLKSYIRAGLTLTEHSPDCSVHTTVIELFVVQLSEKREQDLDASYRVYGTVDGVGDDGLYILWATYGLLVLTEMHNRAHKHLLFYCSAVSQIWTCYFSLSVK